MLYSVSKSTIQRIFRSWRWSWKVPLYHQLHKYTPENINRYCQYMIWIKQCDLSTIKFIDESHFVPRYLSRARALSNVGNNVVIIRDVSLQQSFTLTLLTDLNPANRPLYFKVKTNSNTKFDFLEFVCDAIDAGHLQNGDTLVADNASIHIAEDTLPVICWLCNQHGFSYMLLPKYVNEFNPCELVFSSLKSYFRHHSKHKFLLDLIIAIANIDRTEVAKYYYFCQRF